MAKRHGRQTVVYIDGFDVTGDSNNVEPQITQDEADVASFGDVSHSFLLGQEGGRIAHAGFYNDLATTGIHAVLSARKGSAVIYGVAFRDAAGAYGFAGTARLATYQVGAPIGGAVALANQLTAMGGVDPITVLEPKADLTGPGAAKDDLAGSNGGLSGYVQAFSVLGGTPAFAIQHATAVGGPFTDVVNFTALSARGAELAKAAGTVRQFLRMNVTNGSANAWLAYRRG